MKRTVGIFLVLITLLSSGVFAKQAGYMPTHFDTNVTVSERENRVNVVINNMVSSYENIVYQYMVASVIAEDTDFYIYPLYGTKEPIKIEHNEETIDKIMKEYTSSETGVREIPAYQTALKDLAEDTVHSSNQLIFYFGEGKNEKIFEEFCIIRSWYPNIPVKVITGYPSLSIWSENSISTDFVGNSEYIIDQYLGKYGYSRIPSSYFDYNQQEGTVTIEQGRADANIIAYAQSRKADLLYIGGYMAPNYLYEENKTKKTIKGVSLGYNFLNLEKTAEPKNVAWAVFSIDEELYDVNETGFTLPVKNAETVYLYYKSDMGRGVCSETAKYQRNQDDEIKNLNAPEQTSESSETSTLFEKLNENTESSSSKNTVKKGENKFLEILKAVFVFIGKLILVILMIAWRLFKIALLILAVLMLVNKNVRKNITGRVMNSKAGPIIENIIFKLRILWANITKTDPPIQGVAKEDKNFVFISHSSKDRLIPNNRIETVVKELESRNIKCWISNKNIKTGQNYSGVLAKAIENCSIFLVFLSDASAQSKEVGREMTLATSNGKEIIPVQIEQGDIMNKYNEWKYWLSTSQIKFLFNNNKAGISELADEIEAIYQRYVPDYNLNVVRTTASVDKTTTVKKESVPQKEETDCTLNNENR